MLKLLLPISVVFETPIKESPDTQLEMEEFVVALLNFVLLHSCKRASVDANKVLGDADEVPRVEDGRKQGNHAIFSNAFGLDESIRANSNMPPDLHNGPTGSTPQITMPF
ncbi:hypothetical protein BpHYR1_049391 [Brachionus plicatilis]|uniref:Uncharacterized protein n=1 Tax=Brachionus plicatilis TaxID=10195 RepID=A0A3M7RDQ7_BRAPC|nr:hypothetical protein BpHYR1_049391 [Brachionus plicatilis]